MKRKLISTCRVAFAVLILVVAIIGYVIYERTIIAWWLPVAAAAGIALITLPMSKSLWHWLVGRSKSLEILCHLYVVGCAVYGLLLMANCAFADTSSVHEETVTITGKEHVTRRTGYRTGRHYRTTSRETHSYYVTVRFDNGTTKQLPVSQTRYHYAHKERPWTISMRRGLFGFMVVVSFHQHF